MKANNFKDFIKNNAKKLILALIVILFAVSGSLGLIASSFRPSSSADTSEAHRAGYLEGFIYSANFGEDSGNEDVSPKSLWINFGSLDLESNQSKADSIYVRAGFSTSESIDFQEAIALENGSVKNTFDKVKVGEWQHLASYNLSTAHPSKVYFVIATHYAVRINEIALTGENLKGETVKISLTAEGSGFRGKDNDTTTWNDSLSSAKSDAYSFSSKNAKLKAEKLIDEQSKFSLGSVLGKTYNNAFGALTEREYYALEGVRAFNTNGNYYADKSIGAVGTLILSLGTAVFGYNSLGIRIMPFIFSIASLFVIYALGKILFKKSGRALLFVFLFAVGGFALGLSSVGTVDAIAVFFALLSITFMFRFKKHGVDYNAPLKSFVNVLVSGASFALSICTLSRMVFILPAILVPFIYTLVNFAKKMKALDEKYDYQRITVLGTMIALLTFIILPIILTGIVVMTRFNYFSAHYGSNNLLILIVKKLFGGIVSVSGAASGNAYNSFGWLINYGAEIMGEHKAVFGNIVLTVVNLAFLVYGLILILKPLIKKQKLADGFKSSFVVPFITLSLTMLMTVLGGLIGAVNGISCFYIAQIALSANTVLCVSRLKITESKKTFKNGVRVAPVVAGGVLALMLIVACLSVASLVGLGYFSPLYSFNVLNGGLI